MAGTFPPALWVSWRWAWGWPEEAPAPLRRPCLPPTWPGSVSLESRSSWREIPPPHPHLQVPPRLAPDTSSAPPSAAKARTRRTKRAAHPPPQPCHPPSPGAGPRRAQRGGPSAALGDGAPGAEHWAPSTPAPAPPRARTPVLPPHAALSGGRCEEAPRARSALPGPAPGAGGGSDTRPSARARAGRVHESNWFPAPSPGPPSPGLGARRGPAPRPGGHTHRAKLSVVSPRPPVNPGPPAPGKDTPQKPRPNT